MFIMHMALGGCLKAPPVAYGLTEDTGGHIAYILGAAAEQARLDGVDRIDIVARAFDAPDLGACYGEDRTRVDDKTAIVRLRTARTGYLSKEALEAELPAIEATFLARLSDGPRPDAIHAHFADAACIALEARRRWGIPVIYTPHSLGLGKRSAMAADASGGLARRIARERRVIAECDAIVVSSRDEAERQVEAYGVACLGRVHRWNPGVHLPDDTDGTQKASTLIDPAFTEPAKPLILAVARPVAKKNLVALVDAYATTPGLAERANLAIVAGQGADPGGAPVRDALARSVQANGLRGRVALPPSHDGADVAQLYRLAAARRGVFANPALHEPFGLTVLEAAAAGLPVVVTDQGGPRDIVAQVGHGVCVDPTDRRAIGAACLAAVTRPDAWDGWSEAGRTNLGAFCWRAYAERSVALYRRLASACPVRPALPASRLLVCDIDGTLTGDRAAARRFAARVAAGGIRFAVATGRSMVEARRVLAEWDLPEPETFITSVGSEIWHADTAGRAVLDAEYAAAISDGWDGDAVECHLLADGAAAQAAVERRPWKRSFLGNGAEAARLAGSLRSAGLPANVVASHGRLIDVLPARAGKAAAMRHLAGMLGLDAAACIAAGDSGNDLCMLEAAGTAIVPANAFDELAVLRPSGRLIRTRGRHAAGVLEGLSAVGDPRHRPEASARVPA